MLANILNVFNATHSGKGGGREPVSHKKGKGEGGRKGIEEGVCYGKGGGRAERERE